MAALAQEAGTETSGARQPATLTESGYIQVNGIIEARVRAAEEAVSMQWLYLSLKFLHVAAAIVAFVAVRAFAVPRMADSPGHLQLSALLNALNILLLASVVWAMVFKPTL